MQFLPHPRTFLRLGLLSYLALVLLALPLAAQQDLFVSPFGDDLSGTGTTAAPYRTVSKANSLALTPGDRILIAPGTYSPADGETFPLVLGDGVSLIGPPTGSATIDGSGVLTPLIVIGTTTAITRFEHLRFLGEGVVLFVFGNPQELIVADCSFLGGRRAIDRDFAGDNSILTVERCFLLDMTEYGIHWQVTASGAGALVVNVTDCVITGKNLSVNGLDITGVGGTDFAVNLQRNSVENFNTGLFLSLTGSSSVANFSGTVSDNSFVKEDGSGIEVRLASIGPGVASADMDVAFRHNLLEKNADFGADIRLSANGATSTCQITSAFRGNTVQLNSKSGLYFRETEILGGSCLTAPDLGGGPDPTMGANTFAFNDDNYQSGAEFDLRLESDDDVSAQGNWWFVWTSEEILALGLPFLETEVNAHILDGMDNPLTGTVDFSSYLHGDLLFGTVPAQIVGDGISSTTLVASAGSLFVPGAGIQPSLLTVNGLEVLIFTVSPAGLTLDFIAPHIDLIGGGDAIILVTLPAGQTGSTTQSVVFTSDKGRLECFIATAAFGDPMALELDALRQWRDDVLLQTPLGQMLVRCYYWLSPPLARWIEQSPLRREVTRTLLRPLIDCVASGQAH